MNVNCLSAFLKIASAYVPFLGTTLTGCIAMQATLKFLHAKSVNKLLTCFYPQVLFIMFSAHIS